ncbi:hypothetical protein [[Kitasatospora] papulosa]|uniref:hypothetical protein n=1 Tax=[Kitasatospora] papulosa TaxID=1464011 RepID=UPI003684ECE7
MINRMSTEVTVALIGAGSAIAGALAGGLGAVWAATRAARSTYLGPLHVAQKTAQQQAYTQLLSAANDFEAAMNSVSGAAAILAEDASNRSEGIPSRLSEDDRRARRRRIKKARDIAGVRAAARLVTLAGPVVVAREAVEVEEAGRRLSYAFRDVEVHLDDADGQPRPVMTAEELRRVYDDYASALAKFAICARTNGGHGGEFNR